MREQGMENAGETNQASSSTLESNRKRRLRCH
jgi:hypothetical protein